MYSGVTPKRYLPLREAKMAHHFDHRWVTFEGGQWRELTEAERGDPDYQPLPREWVPQQAVTERLAESGWDADWLLGLAQHRAQH